MRLRFLIPATAILTLNACTWVKPTPEGEKVRVLTPDEVSGCIEMGTTTVSVKHDLAGVERSENKVKWELITLARNSAPNLGGDSVFPRSAISGGKQTFGVYKCEGVRGKDYHFPPLSEPGQ